LKKEIQILLVDDHQVVRDGLQRMLEQEKYFQVVGQSADGEDTLSKIDKLSPDIVMMDIKMPGVDGIELTRQVKREHPSSNIIMLTLYDQYLTQAIEAGARGYLLKDIKREELTQAIRQVHSGQLVIGDSIKSNLQLGYEEQLNRKEEEKEYPDDSVEEIQIILPPSVDTRQLTKFANRVENELHSRVLQMVGSRQEDTIMTVILNKTMALEDIIYILNSMPEIDTVEGESRADEVAPWPLKKSEAIPRLGDRVRITINVTLNKESSLVDEPGKEDYNPSSSLYISS